MAGTRSIIVLLAAAWTAAFSLPVPCFAHVEETPDNILASIGVEEHLGGEVPSGLLFRDEEGKPVRLGDFYGKGPVVLTLNYFTCSMLCPITLRNLLETASGVSGISLARDYRILSVSFDPDERQADARARADEVHSMMKGIPDPASRWAFLTGGSGEIAALTSAVGFRYRKVGAEFAHPDLVVVLTPAGRISRYLYGVKQSPADLKLALIEAAEGRIGDSAAMNRVLLYCFHYDPLERKYSLYARNIMKAGGVLTLALLGVIYLVLWRRRGR